MGAPSCISTLLLFFLAAPSVSRLHPQICAKAPYKYLALEGGGVRGVAYSGAIQALEDAGVLQGLKGFAGTSAGSIGAALLAAGFTAEDVARELRRFDFKSVLQSSGNLFMDASRLMATFGWYPGEPLEDRIEAMLYRKTGIANVSFSQLHELTDKELRVTAVNMNTGSLAYFDRHAHGDMPVAKAVRASSSIPFFFRPLSYKGSLYVDGGVARSLPLDAYSEQSGSTLGLSLMRGGRLSRIVHRAAFESLPEYAAQLLMIFSGMATRSVNDYDVTDENADMVSFNLTEVHPVAFDLCESHKRFMVGVGYNDLADFLVHCGHAEEASLNRPPRAKLEACPDGSEHADDNEKDKGKLRFPQTHEWGMRFQLCVGGVVTVLVMFGTAVYWVRFLRSSKRGVDIVDPRKFPDVALLSDQQCADLHMRLAEELCGRLQKNSSDAKSNNVSCTRLCT